MQFLDFKVNGEKEDLKGGFLGMTVMFYILIGVWVV